MTSTVAVFSGLPQKGGRCDTSYLILQPVGPRGCTTNLVTVFYVF